MLVRTGSPDQTKALAQALAGLCRAGDVVVLAGEMGAGKTAFTQGFALGLGVSDSVTSPTFTIVREYPGERLDLHHLDVYRLDQIREVLELGVGEMLDEDAVMVVEWGDAVLPALGEHILEVRITFGEGDDDRRLEVSARGSRWQARTRLLAETVQRWCDQEGQGQKC
ncbi:MAG: tRNA (adenosine(37)-N6)-threonylcarbamoyltransferase complex ATPase subunit type 1 TsaE [Microthrixaceae bacterium]|nr:tRNA (adenosine(37)-N6)-threonylcarbamoyltransferase complex ATPase subunit type 1 TsaE [Microthrixaceae bacterium]